MIGINSIFRTIQGEGALIGLPMVFVRTSGCSVGCKGCDTDYSNKSRMTLQDIVKKCTTLQNDGWVWITGGEPTDWCELQRLVFSLQDVGFKVAVATSGVRHSPKCDFLSVSPHTLSHLMFTCNRGNQLNIVPGLNGMSLDAVAGLTNIHFEHKYVTPYDGNSETIQQCIDFVLHNSGWKLGIQAHKIWGIK